MRNSFIRFSRKFVDKLNIHVESGRGGNGLKRFNGTGGNGGNVMVEAINLNDLHPTSQAIPTKRIGSKNGINSQKLLLNGSDAPDLTIGVPRGTAVYNRDDKQLIGEVNEIGDRLCVSEGGRGGTMKNGYRGQNGAKGNLLFLLKLIADYGLIGFPNAGKSSFLRTISNAKPKVANYPFTTLRPNLGVVNYEDNRRLTVADLPGLVEGASNNVGLGHNFLRHISRTSGNIFIVDISGFSVPPHTGKFGDKLELISRNVFETFLLLLKEVELYDESILMKPNILLLNKIDLKNSKEFLSNFYQFFNRFEESQQILMEGKGKLKKIPEISKIFHISTINRKGIEEVKIELRKLFDELAIDNLKRKKEK
ncbi:hypothetical protein SNEBB_009614 [Seison nebaliae]|nr:hypothetical protein SNEBB_009614 [Seison nebaliae]